MEKLTEKHASKISGVLSCFDRIVLTGTIPGICYPQGMTGYLYGNCIRIFDYLKLSKIWSEDIKVKAKAIAKRNKLTIEYLKTKGIRKEAKIKKIIKERGDEPGLVHIFSALESCTCYKPWYNQKTRKSYLIPEKSKCLHYYFYIIDKTLGLCYIRVPTWAPFRLQFYFNGHNLLANEMKKKGIKFTQVQNAFTYISDYDKANELANKIDTKSIQNILDKYARLVCPVVSEFGGYFYWSIMQAEWATDIIFKNKNELKPIYDNICETASVAVKAENIATFLGRKLHGNYQGEMGNNLNTRIEGKRIRHTMGPASVKMYDKFGFILRIETTTNNVSFFKQRRKVYHRDGTTSMKNTNMKKTIYSFNSLVKILNSSNKRYIDYISEIETNEVGLEKLCKISAPIKCNNRNYKGLNFFNDEDLKIIHALAKGEQNIIGFQNKNIRNIIGNKSTGQISRMLKRLRLHGVIKKIAKSYKYYLTKFGKEVLIMGLKLKNMYVIPELSKAA